MCTASCESPRFQILHMVYFVQNVQKYRRYKEFEIYVEISTGTTISQEMLKQTVNKNNIHVPVGVSQVSQLVVMILLINDCYVMSLVVIISRMTFVLYRKRMCEIKNWFSCGADGRSAVGCRFTVMWLPNFLRWVDCLSYGDPHVELR